ncbi:zinc finger protein RFP-like isoform X2 [Hemicordylus capensis]|uniref:zinc finger protein RFP-like isoform X2 n=1 Tax=Hemicordylus capensis TaxID=884348 RepID=UPI002302A57D|nr:zinc finger protein RFP-like isoform X2 [Hemicordylus capensis]
MASPSPRKKLKDEATCPICMDFFATPVITPCGHNFCLACITKCWENSPRTAVCPQCRARIKRYFKPNKQLANFVEITREWKVQDEERGVWWRFCERHREPLKLICQADKVPICVVCVRSKEHQNHSVVPVEEAAQEYQEWLGSNLEILKKEKEKILTYEEEAGRESKDLLEQIQRERKKIMFLFRQVSMLQRRFLQKAEEVKDELDRRKAGQMLRLSEELSSLENTIQEMEEECRKPAGELLQEVGGTLKSFKKRPFQKTVAFPPSLKWKIRELHDVNPFLEGMVKQFKDAVISGIQLQRANVTLNPDTAHPRLVLSEDRKSVKYGDNDQDLPDNPERFEKYNMVLGCEGFTAGRHLWEITLGTEAEWAVGVVRKSVRRKGL